MACAWCSLRRGDHVGQRHLDAEIDHPIAVIGQDDVDQVLADVVHVALHRGQHDGALLLAPRPAPSAAPDSATAAFIVSALCSTNGSCILPAPNSSPTTFMPSSRMVLMMSSGLCLVSASSSSSSSPLRSPSTMRSFRRCSTVSAARLLGRRRQASGRRRSPAGLLQRIVILASPVEDQVLDHLHLLRRDQMQRPDLADMHDRARHAGAHRVIEEHRVHHRARRGIEAETDVGQPEDDLYVGEFGRGSPRCPPASIDRACGRPRCRWRW